MLFHPCELSDMNHTLLQEFCACVMLNGYFAWACTWTVEICRADQWKENSALFFSFFSRYKQPLGMSHRNTSTGGQEDNCMNFLGEWEWYHNPSKTLTFLFLPKYGWKSSALVAVKHYSENIFSCFENSENCISNKNALEGENLSLHH